MIKVVSYVSLSDMSDAVYKNEGGEIVVPISQEKFKQTMVTVDPDPSIPCWYFGFH